jgi:hypothetical protein
MAGRVGSLVSESVTTISEESSASILRNIPILKMQTHLPKHQEATKSSIFWNTTPCSSLKINRRFGGTCRCHLHSRRISRARYKHESQVPASTLKMEAICSSEM